MPLRALRCLALTAGLLLWPSLGCAGHSLTAHDGSRILPPTTPRQAMRALDRLLAPEDIARIRTGEITAIEMHFGLGLTLRNYWGLWHGSTLAQWFRMRGVHHPDDMSSVLLDAYVHHVRDEALELRALVAERRADEKAWMAEYEAEQAEGPRRAARVEAARMGWTLGLGFPSRLDSLRAGEGPIRPVRLVGFDGGAIALTRASYRDGRPPEAAWIDAAYFIAEPEDDLHPITTGDSVLHDVLDAAGSTWFLLRRGDDWQLLEHAETSLVGHELAVEAPALRLIDGGDGPLLTDGRRLLRSSDDGDIVELVVAPVRPWFSFDTVRTPRLLGDRLYAADWYGDGHNLLCIVLGDLSGCDPIRDAFFGRIGLETGGIARAADGGLWISAGSTNRASLFHLDPDSRDVGVAVFDGRLDLTPAYHDGRLNLRRLDAEQLAAQIPASAVAAWHDQLYLVGDVGVARVRDGQVEMLVSVDIPEQNINNDWYGGDIGSAELVLFGDPSHDLLPRGFLLADRGIQVLTGLEDAARIRIPEVGEPVAFHDVIMERLTERD